MNSMTTAEAERARGVESFVHPKELTQEELYALDYEEAAWPEDCESALVTYQGRLVVMHPIKRFDDNYSTHVWSAIRRWADMAPHENVAELVAFTTDPEFSSVMRPYFARGTLQDILNEMEEESLEARYVRLSGIWQLLKGAASGLAELHRQGMVHGNLTLSNIALGDEGQAKLIDMRGVVGGTWRWELESYDMINFKEENGDPGQVRYLAPELRSTSNCSKLIATFQSDVFSLGQCAILALDAVGVGNDIGPVFANLLCQMCCDSPDVRLNAVKIYNCFPQKFESYTDFVRVNLMIVQMKLQHDSESLEYLAHERLNAIFIKTQACQENPLKRQLMQSIAANVEQLRIMIDVRVVQLNLESRHDHCRIVRALSSSQWLKGLKRLHISITGLERQSINHYGKHNYKNHHDSTLQSRGSCDRWTAIWKSKRSALSRELIEVVKSVHANASNHIEEVDELCGRYLGAIVTCRHELNVSKKHHSKEAITAMESVDDLLPISKLPAKDRLPGWFLPWYHVLFPCDIKPLGGGSYGQAWLAMLGSNQVVVKTLDPMKSNNTSTNNQHSSYNSSSKCNKNSSPLGTAEEKCKRQQIIREANIWIRLRSPRVVKFFKASHVTSPQFVCEYVEQGSLDNYLKKRNESKYPITHDELWSLLYQACVGLRCLHKRGIAHGDLKCDNILIGSDGMAKLADFGLSYECLSVEGAALDLPPRAVGAFQWKAPERMVNPNEPQVSELKSLPSEWIKSDIYSMGMCFIQAVTNHFPFNDNGDDTVRVKVVRRKTPMVCPNELNKDGWEWKLILDMTKYNPHDRLSIDQVINRIFTNVLHLQS